MSLSKRKLRHLKKELPLTNSPVLAVDVSPGKIHIPQRSSSRLAMVKALVSVTSGAGVTVATLLKEERSLQHTPRHVSRPRRRQSAIWAQAHTLRHVHHIRRLAHPECVDVELCMAVEMTSGRQPPCNATGRLPGPPLAF